MNLKQKLTEWKPYLISAAIALGVGLLSGLLSMSGMREYQLTAVKPPLTPPGWVFSVVWTVLYALMGISAARIWLTEEGKARSSGLNLYVIQLILNFFWSLIFFNAQAYGLAAFWLLLLWAVVLLMILCFYKVDKKAAYLQIPYLIWLTFAAYLNIAVWLLN